MIFHKVILATLLINFIVQDNNVLGEWIATHDETGEKSKVELYMKNDKLYGNIRVVLDKEKKNERCTKCKGERKDMPIEGLMIIRGMSREGSTWTNGDVLDPVSGNVYKCIIKLKDKNTLEVRGYLGVSIFGRTQIWKRKI